jgi:hypothetical protein
LQLSADDSSKPIVDEVRGIRLNDALAWRGDNEESEHRRRQLGPADDFVLSLELETEDQIMWTQTGRSGSRCHSYNKVVAAILLRACYLAGPAIFWE